MRTSRKAIWQMARDTVDAAISEESRRADGRNGHGHRHYGAFDLERLSHHRRTDQIIARVLRAGA